MTDTECLEAVRRLLYLADSYGLTELVVEEGGLKVSVRGEDRSAVTIMAPPPPVEASRPAGENAITDGRYHAIRSPMTGVFFRSATP